MVAREAAEDHSLPVEIYWAIQSKGEVSGFRNANSCCSMLVGRPSFGGPVSRNNWQKFAFLSCQSNGGSFI